MVNGSFLNFEHIDVVSNFAYVYFVVWLKLGLTILFALAHRIVDYFLCICSQYALQRHTMERYNRTEYEFTKV